MTSLPGYDAWKLASPPEYEADSPDDERDERQALECGCSLAHGSCCECDCHYGSDGARLPAPVDAALATATAGAIAERNRADALALRVADLEARIEFLTRR